jgi:hypothetical protein
VYLPCRFYEALHNLTNLKSLTVCQFVPYSTVAQLTQLRSLVLRVAVAADDVQGQDPSVLETLTGLLSLCIYQPGSLQPSGSDWQLWGSQLSSALTALTRLQRVELPHVSRGVLADALAQLVSVTRLCIEGGQFQRDTLHLPSVRLLELGLTDWGFLDTGLHAPQLRVLRRDRSSDVVIWLEEPEDVQHLTALVERCARGALKCCTRLALSPGPQEPEPETVTAVLGALGRWWRPDPSLVDGSHPVLQASARDDDEAGVGPATGAGGWRLSLRELLVSRAALAALPQGLTHLELW